MGHVPVRKLFVHQNFRASGPTIWTVELSLAISHGNVSGLVDWVYPMKSHRSVIKSLLNPIKYLSLSIYIYIYILIYTYIYILIYIYINIYIGGAGIIERKLRSTKVRLFTVPCCSIILFSSEGVKKNVSEFTPNFFRRSIILVGALLFYNYVFPHFSHISHFRSIINVSRAPFYN